jgi:D-alanyl-D-alanine carboxypeptidase/D-alanyl-D-alanine-endopeptidase (penicillin-binding protein 4)
LEANGIPVALAAESDRTLGSARFRPGKILDTYASPPLAEIVDRTNLRSINLYAEALLREINKSRGKEGFELSSTEIIREWLADQGLPVQTIRLEDGSGLATRNFFPPSLMTALLRKQAGASRWRLSLPVAGQTGSMKGYLKGTAATGRLQAKSGSLGAVRAYAGYATRQDGAELAFAIMVNNYTTKSRYLNDKMLDLMLTFCTAPLR